MLVGSLVRPNLTLSSTRTIHASSLARAMLEDSIREKLTTTLSPTHLKIRNDSAAHAGHMAMKQLKAGGGSVAETHFMVEVVSDEFEGKRSIQRHRMVNDALKEEFALGLHALQIKARTTKEFEALNE
ncbi:hypothetical protein MNV49_007688 [Pseudohyphozyma bogoriensis]|nr:hypothetical protein MNV49_007688 [Pseudohyphozyma bogoriensis]